MVRRITPTTEDDVVEDGDGVVKIPDWLQGRRFAIINVWRGVPGRLPLVHVNLYDADNYARAFIPPTLRRLTLVLGSGDIMRAPLAVCDPTSVDPRHRIDYEMLYPDRVGHNYALTHSPEHRWMYFPRMTEDEALVFSVYDSSTDHALSRRGFVFHTSFDDPNSHPDAPPRRSVEARAVAIWRKEAPPVFFDMAHSNNAARIRIWLALKGVPKDAVDVRMVTYADLQSDEYARVNSLKKVPALIDAQGNSLFEASVILNYLEDKFAGVGVDVAAAEGFRMNTPEARAVVEHLVRVHDLYIASPNNTQPGFAHTQGAMYLAPYETPFTSKSRAMPVTATRAAKIAEIWRQLSWLEAHLERRGGPYLAGATVTHADMTWHPTCVFMEYMLPLVFGWPESLFGQPILDEPGSPLPHVTAW